MKKRPKTKLKPTLIHTIIMFFFVVFLTLPDARAFGCYGFGQSIPAGGNTKPVDILVSVAQDSSGKMNTVIDLNQITCFGADGAYAIDTLRTNAMDTVLTPKLASELKSGLIINNKKYYTPIASWIQVLTLKSHGRDYESKPLNIKFFFESVDHPSKNLIIQAGDTIGEISLHQTNDTPGCPKCGDFKWRLIAKNDVAFKTNTCTINDGRNINIDFGKVILLNISRSAYNEGYMRNQDLKYHCDAPVTQSISINLIGDKSAFSPDLIKTSNEYIGVAMLYKGTVIAPGKTFISQITQGNGFDSVSFNIVRDNVSYDKIAKGPFTGSAVLIIGIP